MGNTGWKWGDWIEARAYYAGLKSRSALRRALDVSERHLARWLKSDQPPRLQERSLQKLAECLRVEKIYITENRGLWFDTEPEDIPLVGGPVLMLTEIEGREAGTSNLAGTKRREIKGIVDTLSGEKLDKLYEIAIGIASKHLDDRIQNVAAKRTVGPKYGKPNAGPSEKKKPTGGG